MVRLILVITIALALSSSRTAAQETPLATVVSDIIFGVAYPPNYSVPGVNIIGTNSVINYAAGFMGAGIGSAGAIQINGTAGLHTEISCESSKTMRHSGSMSDRSASAFYVTLGTANAAGPGMGHVCGGLDKVVIDTQLPVAAPERMLQVGMAMHVHDVTSGGEYRLSYHHDGDIIIRIRQMQGADIIAQIDVRMDAVANFIRDVSLTATEINFGTIEVAERPGNQDYIQIGTNGAVDYAGVFSGAQYGTPGNVAIAGAAEGTMLEVYCSADAVLAASDGGATMTLGGVEVAAGNSVLPYGHSPRCGGIGHATPAMTLPFRAGSSDRIYVGGRLQGGGIIPDGRFSTANPGGRPIEIEIIMP